MRSGRYPLAGWGFNLGEAHTGRISRPEAVALALAQVLNFSDLGAQPTLDSLVHALRGIQPVSVWADSPMGLAKPIAALAAANLETT